jgi:hypothetical protein
MSLKYRLTACHEQKRSSNNAAKNHRKARTTCQQRMLWEWQLLSLCLGLLSGATGDLAATANSNTGENYHWIAICSQALPGKPLTIRLLAECVAGSVTECMAGLETIHQQAF